MVGDDVVIVLVVGGGCDCIFSGDVMSEEKETGCSG
jgi:hypothetical protein